MPTTRLLLLAAAATVSLVLAVARPTPPRPQDLARARAPYAVLQQRFYRPDVDVYGGTYPRYRPSRYSQLWPLTQAVAATTAMAALPGAGAGARNAALASVRQLGHYWSGAAPASYSALVQPPLGTGNAPKFYDDNDWAGLDLLEIARVTGSKTALARARQAFAMVVSGWDAEAGDPCPGGVFWRIGVNNRDRVTVSTAPGAELGAELYLMTGDQSALDWAKRMYAWEKHCLRLPSGLYADNVKIDGSIDQMMLSYNQGAMIGAGVALARATGQTSYLTDARGTADVAMKRFAPGDGELPYLTGIFLGKLLELGAVTGDARYRTYVEKYADTIWNTDRVGTTALFRFHHSRQIVQLLEQAAMARLYALLASSPTHSLSQLPACVSCPAAP
jgi:hypothetical protein